MALEGDLNQCLRASCIHPAGHGGACVDQHGHVLSKRSYGYPSPGRTLEAQADIAAARAAPIEDDVAVTQDLDVALSNAALADTPAMREMGGSVRYTVPGMGEVCTHAVFTEGCRICHWRVPIGPDDLPRWGAPSGPAIPPSADAVRGSIRAWRRAGGNIGIDTTHTIGGLLRSPGGRPHIEIDRADLDDAIAALQVLAGTPPPGDHTPILPPGAVLLTGNEAAHYRRFRDAARASQAAQNALATAAAEIRDAVGALCKAISVEPSRGP